MCIHLFQLGTKNVKFISAQQGTQVYHFNGTKEGLYKTYASIWIEACAVKKSDTSFFFGGIFCLIQAFSTSQVSYKHGNQK